MMTKRPLQISEMIGGKTKSKKWLTGKTKKFLVDKALEAHRIDPSQPMQYYYKLFVQRLRDAYLKKDFFQENVILGSD